MTTTIPTSALPSTRSTSASPPLAEYCEAGEPGWFYASAASGWVPFHSSDNVRLEKGWRSYLELNGHKSPAEYLEQRRDEKRERRRTGQRSDARHDGEDDEDEDDDDEDDVDLAEQVTTGVEALKGALRGDDAEKDKPKDTTKEGRGDDDGETAAEEAKEETKGKKRMKREMLDPDETDEQRARRGRVEVLEDHLFEVDLKKMECFSAFWKSTVLRVVRATWFYSSATDGGYAPIAWDEPLAADLERAYQQDRPWERFGAASAERSADAGDDGAAKATVAPAKDDSGEAKEGEPTTDKARAKEAGAGEDRGTVTKPDEKKGKKRYDLPSMESKAKVGFDGPSSGRIFGEDLTGRLMSVLGGSIVVRGFDEASRLAEEKGSMGFKLPDMPFPWAKGDKGKAPEHDEERAEADKASAVGILSGVTAKAKSAAESVGGGANSSAAGGGDAAESGVTGMWNNLTRRAASMVQPSDPPSTKKPPPASKQPSANSASDAKKNASSASSSSRRDTQAAKNKGKAGALRAEAKAGAARRPTESGAAAKLRRRLSKGAGASGADEKAGAGNESSVDQGEAEKRATSAAGSTGTVLASAGSTLSKLVPTSAGSWFRSRAETRQEVVAEDTMEEALEGEPSEDDVEGEADGEGEPSDELASEPPELILCIHGIGQKLTEDVEGLDFVYDVERLRNLAQERRKDPALRRISRGRRTQFLPICWRHGLGEFQAAAEGNDNQYHLMDISNDAAIPFVRNIIAKVVLDVPFYLSRHKKAMVDAVRAEINRVYRLFVRRNPEFEKRGGRVSFVAHSLGSALAADILSEQPTHVPTLGELSPEERRRNDRLHFNVKNVFLIGSPLPFFLYLQGAQLIARRGTRRTKDAADDAALDVVGRYGCLATEAIYNCYNLTDPVAFSLGGTISAKYASVMRPISIPGAVRALLESLDLPRLSVSRLFNGATPFSKDALADLTDDVQKRLGPGQKLFELGGGPGLSTGKRQEDGEGKGEKGKKDQAGGGQGGEKREEGRKEEKQRAKALLDEQRGGIEHLRQIGHLKEAGIDMEELEKAERRFRALNPHGAVDFFFESEGLNEYLSMLLAHTSYWGSDEFCIFLLAATHLDVDEAKKEKQQQQQQQQQQTSDL